MLQVRILPFLQMKEELNKAIDRFISAGYSPNEIMINTSDWNMLNIGATHRGCNVKIDDSIGKGRYIIR